MGYSTDYAGQANIVPGLDASTEALLNDWLSQRHLCCDPEHIERCYRDVCTVDGQPLGQEAWNWVPRREDIEPDYMFNKLMNFVTDHNTPPFECPSLWSDIEIRDNVLRWNGTEKTYHFVDWLIFIQTYILYPLGCHLEGQFDFRGEDPSDCGSFYINGSDITGDMPLA